MQRAYANHYDRVYTEIICLTADRHLNEPVSLYEIPDGIRLLETSKRIQRRIAALAMAYNIFGEEKYAQRCYAELEAACNFKDWNPSHFLDIAEMSTAFALGYDWLYHWMNDEQRAFLRNNMIEKGLTQVMEDYEDKPRTRTYRWYQNYPGDNWKLVCNGSMTMTALLFSNWNYMIAYLYLLYTDLLWLKAIDHVTIYRDRSMVQV